MEPTNTQNTEQEETSNNINENSKNTEQSNNLPNKNNDQNTDSTDTNKDESPMNQSDKDRILNDLKQTAKDFWLLWVHLMAPITNYIKDKYETISPSKREKIEKVLNTFKKWSDKWWKWFKKLITWIWAIFATTPKTKDDESTKDKQKNWTKENIKTNEINSLENEKNSQIEPSEEIEKSNEQPSQEIKNNINTKKKKNISKDNKDNSDIINEKLKKYRPNKNNKQD